MKAKKVLFGGLTATSLMTMFSYVVSNYKNENFKEPELLAAVLKDVLPSNQLPLPNNQLLLPLGWGTHYSMGIVWAALFELLFEKTAIEPGCKSGLALGGISGLTAIAVWGLTFKVHSNPPRTDYKRFYGHLFLAHIVYSLAITATAKMK